MTPTNFYDNPLKIWMKDNIHNFNKNILGIPWQVIFSFAIRTIWLSRNHCVFSGTIISPPSIKNTIIFKAANFYIIVPLCKSLILLHTLLLFLPPPIFHWLGKNLNRDGLNSILMDSKKKKDNCCSRNSEI